MPIRIRRDSRWNVPEPELTLVQLKRPLQEPGDVVRITVGELTLENEVGP
jgi:fumarylacetoacetate (FAA) hydrolase family protein